MESFVSASENPYQLRLAPGLKSIYKKKYQLVYHDDHSVSLKLVTTYSDGTKKYEDPKLDRLPNTFELLLELEKMQEAFNDSN